MNNKLNEDTLQQMCVQDDVGSYKDRKVSKKLPTKCFKFTQEKFLGI